MCTVNENTDNLLHNPSIMLHREYLAGHFTLYWFSIIVQPYDFPSSASLAGYRIQYQAESDLPGTWFVSSSSSETTLQNLEFGKQYTLNIRTELRFIYCDTLFYGEYSPPIHVTTVEEGTRTV